MMERPVFIQEEINSVRKLYPTTLAACLVALGSLSLPAQTPATGSTAATGSGTANYIPIWTSSSKLGDSILFQKSGNVGVGTTSPAHPLDVTGAVNSSGGYMIGGTLVLNANSADSTTAVGGGALQNNSGVTANTAVGQFALQTNTTGGDNSAFGFEALQINSTGVDNTAVGNFALQDTTASNNTAVGYSALSHIGTGTNNVALGYEAGLDLTGANSNNIEIGYPGVAGDNNTIRIGNPSSQTAFFAAGIRGVTTGLTNAIPVMIDGNGQLGTVSSSVRFKEDIHDMAGASDGLLKLHPVTYRYKQPYADGSKPIDYGLIAEEVAQVYPDLVARSADGQIETVQYQKLTPMLLNEIQKQHQLAEQQSETIRLLEKRLEALEAK